MLKTVSSVANALGALNYKGTWDAATNTPTLASGVGTQGDYYVVSVAGTTDLDGITNWGVGDWAAFNGSVWQRVEGGADGNFVNLDVTGTATFDGEILANGGITVGNKKVNLGSTGGAQLTLASGAITVTASNHQLLNEGGAANDDLDTINGGTSGDILILSAASNGQDISVKNGTGNIVLSVASGDCTLGNIKDKIILIYQGSAWYEVSRSINAGGATTDFTVSGNLVIGTSGKGIDFSATAGTGTSELLDDYEEGVWTPTYTTSGTDFDSVTYGIQTGSYVKIGELVTVFCAIRTNSLTVGSGTGNVRVGGLPFTVGSTADQWNNATALRAGFVDATNFELVSCFGTEAVPRDINNNQAALTDLDTGANDNHLTFTLSYRV